MYGLLINENCSFRALHYISLYSLTVHFNTTVLIGEFMKPTKENQKADI